jgi:hypothetical protein
MTDFTEKDLSDEGKEWFDTINEEVDAFTVDSLRHFLFENSTIRGAEADFLIKVQQNLISP